MNVILRAGDLDRDAAPLLSLLQAQLSASIDRHRLDWLYRLCPHGEAKFWVATEASSGRLVGAAAVLPRKLNSLGGAAIGFVLGDFCVSADHRSLGLAVQLQRKCLESVHHQTFSAGYDFPSRTMLAVYRRLNLQPGAEMTRMVKLLRADGKIAARVKLKMAARVLSEAANALLALERSSMRLQSGVSVHVQEERCGQEYTDLASDIGGHLGTCVDRSAEYLNWRYFDHPQHRYEILAARRCGRLEGYVTLCQEGSTAMVVDWFGRGTAEIRRDLIRGAIAVSKRRRCESIQASILASHVYHGDLLALGFRRRESSPVIFIGGTEREPSTTAKNENWLLMDGDRES